MVGGLPCSLGGAGGLGFLGPEAGGLAVCPQGVRERAYASSGEAITSLPVSIPLSTVQPSKLPVSIPLASVVLPSRAEKVVSAGPGPEAGCPEGTTCGNRERPLFMLFLLVASRLSPFLLNFVWLKISLTAMLKRNRTCDFQIRLQ